MRDDLVKRLRELDRLHSYADKCEAASRIEKLEAGEIEFDRVIGRYASENARFRDRIEKLEAALDDAVQYVSRADWHYLKDETRKALDAE